MFSYFLKFSLNISATLRRLSLNSSLFFHELAGLRIFESTPSILVGYCKLKIGKVSKFESVILPS